VSTDYGASICVGYRFSTDDALKPFAKKKGEDRFHMEDRFDPITGKKTGQEKVWDERSETFHEWNGIRTTDDDEDAGDDYVTSEDLLEKIGAKLGFKVFVYGDDCNEVVFMPKKHPKDVTEGYDWGRMTADGNLSWHAVAAMGKDLEALRQKLLKLGLKPKKPEVVLAATVC
jgi:hypothetical protein